MDPWRGVPKQDISEKLRVQSLLLAFTHRVITSINRKNMGGNQSYLSILSSLLLPYQLKHNKDIRLKVDRTNLEREKPRKRKFQKEENSEVETTSELTRSKHSIHLGSVQKSCTPWRGNRS